MSKVYLALGLAVLSCSPAFAQMEIEREGQPRYHSAKQVPMLQDDYRKPKTGQRCSPLLLSLCSTFRDRPVAVMAAGQFGLSLSDSIRTEALKARAQDEGGTFMEADPLARPFVDHPAALYAFDVGGAVATAWLAHRMRHSSHRWERNLWWLPQSMVIAGNIGGIAYTHRRP